MTVRDQPSGTRQPVETDEALEELIVELDDHGVIEDTSHPDWVQEGLPRIGQPITDTVALDGAGLRGALERTRRTGRSERVVARLLWASELQVVTGRLIPRLGSVGFRGWLLALRPAPDLQTRLLEASPGILIRAVEQMSFGVALADRHGKIVYTNRAEAEMHGYAPGELVGRFARELGASESTSPPEADRPNPWSRRRVNRRKDGSRFPVRLISDEIRDEQGRFLGRVTLTEDVGESARLERMKEEFLRVVSHELRTPLTSILASLSLLQGQSSPGERWTEALAIAERNSRHLLSLVEDLLDFQNAVAGHLEVHLAPVPVVSVLDEAAERAAESRAGRSGTLRSRIVVTREELPDEEVSVQADRRRLLQVLDQLISNGLKFSSPADPVRLHAARGPERTTLMVTDHGPGIPADVRRRLFEPFSQADASTTRRDAGAGLGLALAKALVETMHGELELIPDDGEPFGTTFLVHLPNA